MKNTNQEPLPIESNEPILVADKGYLKPIAYAMAILLLVPLAGMQVKAFFVDTTLEALEASHKSSVIQYDKLLDTANKAIESSVLQHETRCSTYKALKAYKESKNIAIQDPLYNPCTQPVPFQTPEPNSVQIPPQLQITPEAPLNSSK
jgi:hypothetical protein